MSVDVESVKAQLLMLCPHTVNRFTSSNTIRAIEWNCGLHTYVNIKVHDNRHMTPQIRTPF